MDKKQWRLLLILVGAILGYALTFAAIFTIANFAYRWDMNASQHSGTVFAAAFLSLFGGIGLAWFTDYLLGEH